MEISVNELIADALARQEVERQTGFAIENEALHQLMGLAQEELILTVRGLLREGKAERELGARLLGSETLSGGAVRAEVDAALTSVIDPEVIRWLVGALGKTRDPDSLPMILRFVVHPQAQVRFMVPDALDACATHFSQVAETLFVLAGDRDRDVRWSAVFELAAWLDDDESRLGEGGRSNIERHLRGLLVTEHDLEIRELLETALSTV